jgi:hypothetical protein
MNIPSNEGIFMSMKQILFEVIFRNKQELMLLLTANGVTWLSVYFIPIVGACTAIVSLATTLFIFVKEYKKSKKEGKRNQV